MKPPVETRQSPDGPVAADAAGRLEAALIELLEAMTQLREEAAAVYERLLQIDSAQRAMQVIARAAKGSRRTK